MLTCEQILELLDAYRTGELEERDHLLAADHLTTCHACNDELDSITGLARALKARSERAPTTLAQRVREALGDRLGRIETALGPVWVGFNDRGVTFVSLDDAQSDEIAEEYQRRLGRLTRFAEVPERWARAVTETAEGRWSSDVPVDLEGLPAFERRVLEKMRTIPRGEVRPYAWLAAEAGSPRAVRAVGNIMNRNPIPLLLPCHRVVPSTGGVGNYAYGPGIKRTLLEREGVSTDSIDELARRRVRYMGSDSTRIYCYPTCRDARRIQPRHQVPFPNERAAKDAGYRPCQHCRPLSVAV